jgi:hypothetical protein
VQPGDILEWGVSLVLPNPATEGPAYLEFFYPLWWEDPAPEWTDYYDDYGTAPFLSPLNVTVSDTVYPFLPATPAAFTGSAVVPADRARASIEFIVQPDTGADDPIVFYVLGCWVRVTTPPAIT